MDRRGFLTALIGAATLDPERLLWVPGKKLISIPSVKVFDWWEQIPILTAKIVANNEELFSLQGSDLLPTRQALLMRRRFELEQQFAFAWQQFIAAPPRYRNQ